MIGRFGEPPEPRVPEPETSPPPPPPPQPPTAAKRDGPLAVTDEERLLLRGWVEKCRVNYVGLALEIAQLEDDKDANAAKVEISYGKLKRVREEFEEAKKVLMELD